MTGRSIALLAAAGALVAGGAWFLVHDGGGPARDRGTPERAADPGAKPKDAGPAAVEGPGPATPAPKGGDGTAAGLLLRSLTGAPIPGTVRVTDRSGGTRTQEIGANGAIVVKGLPRGEPLRFEFTSPGLLPLVLAARTVPADDDLDLSYVFLGEGQRVDVVVVDETGAPVADCALSLGDYPYGDSRGIPTLLDTASFRTSSDVSGRASFEAVPPGTWFLTAVAAGRARALLPVELVEGALRGPVRVVLGPGVVLEGRVVHADGRPVPAAAIAAAPVMGYDRYPLSATGATDAEGRFRLEGLAAGRVVVSVQAHAGVVEEAAHLEVPTPAPIEIRLAPRAEIRGKVVDDATESGIEGAEVHAYLAAPAGPTIGARTSGRSGPDGAFRFPDLPAIPLQYLTASKPGWVPAGPDEERRTMATGALEAGAAKEVEIRLRRGVVVRGVVRDSTGAVVPVAWVRLMLWKGTRQGMHYLPEVRSDAEGRYVIPGALPGKGLFEAGARNRHLPGVPEDSWNALRSGDLPESCSVEIPETGEAVKDLVLVPDSRVEGRIVRADGAPAPGFVARLEDAESPPGGGILGTASGADGSFFIEDLAPASGMIVGAYGPAGRVGKSEPFDLVESEVTRGITVVVKAPGSLEGRVRRADGKPLEGASLVLHPVKFDPEKPWEWQWRGRNGTRIPVAADGTFLAEGLAAGDWTPVAAAAGCLEKRCDGLALADGEKRTGYEIVLAEGLSLAGRVLDPEGSPVAGATVKAQRVPDPGADEDPDAMARTIMLRQFGEGRETEATTDAEGRFRVPGLEAGEHEVTAWKKGFLPGRARGAAGAGDMAIRLEAGLPISGRVVESGTGKGVPGVAVHVTGSRTDAPGGEDEAAVMEDLEASTTITVMNGVRTVTRGRGVIVTEADGSFTLDALAPGSYDLQLTDGNEAYAPKVVRGVRAGKQGLVVEMAAGLSIAGRIEDAGGLPLEVRGLTVEIAPLGKRDAPFMGQSEEVGKGGVFSFRGLPAGRYRVTAGSRAWSDTQGAYSIRVVEADAGRTDLVIPLTRGKAIRGRVLLADGNPATDGNVEVEVHVAGSGAPPPGGAWASTEENGTFTTDPLPDGQAFDLVARNHEDGTVAAVRGVAPGTASVVLRLEKGGTIRGKVVDPEGKPLENASVWAVAGAESVGASTPSGDSGAFVIEGLPPGSYRLYASSDAGNLAPVEPEAVVAVGTVDAVVKTSKGFEFRARVVTDEGKPVAEVNAFAQRLEKGTWIDAGMAVVADGALVIRSLPKCRVRVRLFRSDEPFLEEDEDPASYLGPFEVPGEEPTLTFPR
jgi:protocatechuate 3,4-dioxygenase beta subunit